MAYEKNKVNPIVETDGSTALTSGEAPVKLISLEVSIKYAEGLEPVHKTHGLKTFPAVFIASKDGTIFDDTERPKHFDRKGGSNPKWNTSDVFYIDIDEARQKELDLVVQVESKRFMSCGPGIKVVGKVSIAIEDLLKDFGDAVDSKSVTLGVMNKKGKAHGKLTFTYKFGRTLNPQPADPSPQNADLPNENPVTQTCNNNSHLAVKAVVGGVVSGLVTALGELIRDSLM